MFTNKPKDELVEIQLALDDDESMIRVKLIDRTTLSKLDLSEEAVTFMLQNCKKINEQLLFSANLPYTLQFVKTMMKEVSPTNQMIISKYVNQNISYCYQISKAVTPVKSQFNPSQNMSEQALPIQKQKFSGFQELQRYLK